MDSSGMCVEDIFEESVGAAWSMKNHEGLRRQGRVEWKQKNPHKAGFDLGT